MHKLIVVSPIAAALLFASVATAQVYYPNYSVGAMSVATVPSYATPTYGSCVYLTSDLSYGMRNAQVRQLQQFLVSQNVGASSWMITGYFGPATRQAVMNFQRLAGLSQTGYVDASTRAAIQARSCGGTTIPHNPIYPYPTNNCNSYNSYNSGSYNYWSPCTTYGYNAPEIVDVEGPSTVEENEEEEWDVEIESSSNQYVTVTVDWGDDECDYYNNYNNYNSYSYYNYSNYGYNCTDSQYVYGDDTVTFDHEYSDEGTYTIRITATGSGGSDSWTEKVRVRENDDDDDDDDDDLELDRLSPDEGEVGDTIIIHGEGFTSSNDVHFGIGGEEDVNSTNGGTRIEFEIPDEISACDIDSSNNCSDVDVEEGTYSVYVKNSNGTSNILYFTVED